MDASYAAVFCLNFKEIHYDYSANKEALEKYLETYLNN